MVLGEPAVMAETNREGVAEAKVRILHEGREGVERVVPVVKGRKARPRTSKEETDTTERTQG